MGWKIYLLIILIFIISCSQEIEQPDENIEQTKGVSMVENLEWLGHASFKITGEKVIYIDPFKLKGNEEKADLILITHEHFDHCSPEDISKIQKEDTIIVAPEDCKAKLTGNMETILPNSEKTVAGIKIETIPAYNIDKFREPGIPFHPKENNWIGYIININSKRIYHAGDTDNIPEMKTLKDIDIALLPVGGTYTMTAEEAAQAANIIKAKLTIPMHYNDIVGTKDDADKFKELVEGNVEIFSKRTNYSPN